MTKNTGTWTIRLSASAENDYRNILRWTNQRFGRAQALAYAETLTSAIAALAAGPDITGVRTRDDIAKGIRTFHVARHRRNGRHFVMFRIGKNDDQPAIEVLRLLHDAMDLPRHLPAVTDNE